MCTKEKRCRHKIKSIIKKLFGLIKNLLVLTTTSFFYNVTFLHVCMYFYGHNCFSTPSSNNCYLMFAFIEAVATGVCNTPER